MNILVTNDDGYFAPGIKKLAEVAKKFGEVTLVAPASQCSAMSHRLTISGEMIVREENIGVDGIKAYSVTGTPADSVRAAVDYIYRVKGEKPDIVFSGINNGYNAGYDIEYSGTIGAAMEAIMFGRIPAIAFSMDYDSSFEIVDRYLEEIIGELLKRDPLPHGEIWNVNFPGCTVEECKGIKWGVKPAQVEYHNDHYDATEYPDGSVGLVLNGSAKTVPGPDTDYDLLMKDFITIGTTKNAIMTNI